MCSKWTNKKTTDPVSQDQAEAVIAIANEKLIDLTGFVE